MWLVGLYLGTDLHQNDVINMLLVSLQIQSMNGKYILSATSCWCKFAPRKRPVLLPYNYVFKTIKQLHYITKKSMILKKNFCDIDSSIMSHWEYIYSIYKLEQKARIVCVIQHGRESCKWHMKLFQFYRSIHEGNFKNISFIR